MATDWKDMLSSLTVDTPADTPADENIATEAVTPKSVRKGVTLFYETKGRGGKKATILADFAGVDDGGIEELASEIKRALGTGGSCRGGEILVQGDRRAELRKLLSSKGFTVKG